jgi:hypothetical protein
MDTKIESKTILSITADNTNTFIQKLDLRGIDDEATLRVLHSILDELKDDVLLQIRELNNEKTDDISIDSEQEF